MRTCQPARFWKKSFFYSLKAVALVCMVWGEEENKGEQSLVAATSSKIDAGVDLLVREVGVALLLCHFSGRRDMCICSLCFARAFKLSKSDVFPQKILSGVSVP